MVHIIRSQARQDVAYKWIREPTKKAQVLFKNDDLLRTDLGWLFIHLADSDKECVWEDIAKDKYKQ